ncbi:hypothetical protein [Fibrivirga algicola]|uniref:Uncharacterized protein n=1 Tax=Fibrivirga algicola TaxID=2950420 RepID=A0ABX0QJZ7_9BACT|nr:hypothetical protein [Fibrivirga algicola]NID12417.1 hypothetical protein [Fibrivirga algicola]
MKRPVWWLLGSAVLALLGWFGYQYWADSQQSIARYVPADALLIIESRELQRGAVPLTNTAPQGLSIRQLPLFATAANRLQRIVGTSLDSSGAARFLHRKLIRYSLHPVTRDVLDFVFYVPVNNDQQLLEQLQQPDPNRFRVLSRQYEGQTIYNLRDLTNQSYGFFLLYHNCLIGSASGVLAENVARHLQKTIPGKGITFPDAPDDLATLFVDTETLDQLVATEASAGSLLRVFLPQTMTLQFRRSASPTHWLGFASDAVGNRQAIADLFTGQTPHRIRSGNLIPSRVATLYHVGLSDSPSFGKSMARLMKDTENEGLRERIERSENLLPDFYAALAGDLLLCRSEASNEATNQILLLEATDVRALSQSIQKIAYRLGASRAGTPRTFLGHQLLPLSISELPATLLSNLFTGFPQTWITQHDRYVVLANSEAALQTYLTQLTSKAVWSNDAKLAQLLNQTLRPAHLTTFTQLNRSGLSVTRRWPTTWQSLLGEFPFGQVENLAYQAAYGKDHILSTIVLGRTTRQADTTVLNKLLLRKRIPFNASLIASPVVIGRLSDPSAQIWAQNSAQQFVLLTTDKDKIVQDTTDGPIRSNVIGVDWRNNGRLQYLFMTDRSLYVADLGNRTVQLQRIKRPPGLESALITRFSGSSKLPDIAALIAHKDGSIYGLDRRQQLLIPLFRSRKPSPLLLPFQVINQGQTAAVLGLQTNKFLNRWTDQGGKEGLLQTPRFPALLDLQGDSTKFAGPALWLPAEDRIATITTDGELLSLKANGLIAARKQLYRPLRGGQFRLFPDTEQTGYVLLRSTDTDVAVLDALGNRQFELRNLRPEETHLQYHRLGNGVEILAVKSGNFTTLYTLKGQRIGDRPIPSLFPVTLQYDAQMNELYIVSSIQKAVQLFTIRLR